MTRRTKPTETPGREIIYSVNVNTVVEIERGGRSYNILTNRCVLVVIQESDIVGNELLMHHSHGLHS